MPLLCPECRESLEPGGLTCRNRHRFAVENGVLVLLDERFGRRLRDFLRGFEPLRAAAGKRLVDPGAFENLPEVPCGMGDAQFQLEWRLRRYDWAVIRRTVGAAGPLRILDVGAWNGWLSHRLAGLGHDVTAVDYFVDECDGLGARKFYSTRWQAIQIDLTDLPVLGERFDVVIVNRCLQFFVDPVGYLTAARRVVAPEGLLVATGLPFYRSTTQKKRQVAELGEFLRRNGCDPFKSIKGYLDWSDARGLRLEGFALRAYPPLWRATLRARVQGSRPVYRWAVWRHERLP